VSLPRSWLYVPGHRPDRVRNALASGADAVVIDLEDAVPAAAKDEARRSTVALLEDRPSGSPPVWVRVNPPTAAVGRADVEALAATPVDGLRLPRCEDPEVVHAVAEQTGHALYLLLETARGLLSARELAGAHTAVRGMGLGESDLAADLMVPSDAGLDWARGYVVAASRAAGLGSPVQSVWTRVGDLYGLRASCVTGLAMGFFGRSVVHPSQIPVVHEVFTPLLDEVAEARAVLATGSEARAMGEVAALDAQGRFVDPAVEARARVVLDRIPVDHDVDRDPKGEA
jgi:citrate lyase subunit beta/citryl-CoA lyase